MKTCPKCKHTYTDTTLNYCLADGSILSALDKTKLLEPDVPTVIRQVPSNGTRKINIKTPLLIFLLLAIPITLFPPFSWGEEKLQTEADQNKPLFSDVEEIVAKEVLPISQFAFVFGNHKRVFSAVEIQESVSHNSSSRPSRPWRSKEGVILHGQLIVSQLAVEYLAALLAAFLSHLMLKRLLAWRKRRRS